MKRWLVVAAMLFATVPALAARQVDPRGFFPPSYAVEGWILLPQLRVLTPRDLADYIGGEAARFRAYGMEYSIESAYVSGSRADRKVTVDIYDMGTPLHAFGAFTSERPEGAKKFSVGVQGYSEGGLVAFWRGPYYVKVSESDQGDEAAAAELAKATADRLPRDEGLPEQLKRLPEENRVPGSEKYVRVNALGHKFLQEDVSAEYTLGKVTGELHVMDLGTRERASDGRDALREFEAKAGLAPTELIGVGKRAFAVNDPSLGEFVAARSGRFLVIGTSKQAGRAEVIELVLQGLRTARRNSGRVVPGPADHPRG